MQETIRLKTSNRSSSSSITSNTKPTGRRLVMNVPWFVSCFGRRKARKKINSNSKSIRIYSLYELFILYLYTGYIILTCRVTSLRWKSFKYSKTEDSSGNSFDSKAVTTTLSIDLASFFFFFSSCQLETTLMSLSSLVSRFKILPR